jgi:hypothetical protein
MEIALLRQDIVAHCRSLPLSRAGLLSRAEPPVTSTIPHAIASVTFVETCFLLLFRIVKHDLQTGNKKKSGHGPHHGNGDCSSSSERWPCVDPGSNVDRIADVAFRAGRVAGVEFDIPPSADSRVDATAASSRPASSTAHPCLTGGGTPWAWMPTRSRGGAAHTHLHRRGAAPPGQFHRIPHHVMERSRVSASWPISNFSSPASSPSRRKSSRREHDIRLSVPPARWWPWP